MAWSTAAEALTYTKIAVDDSDIEAAQAMIEVFADVTEDALIGTKNLRLLKMAVAYQAAWITDHPDVFTHVDVSSMLQDGIQFVNNNMNSGVLAPMAKRAIDRLSWRRNRSLRVRRPKSTTQRGIGRIGYLGSISGEGYSSSSGSMELRDRGMWEAE